MNDDFRDNFIGDNFLNRAGQTITNARAHNIGSRLPSITALAGASADTPRHERITTL